MDFMKADSFWHEGDELVKPLSWKGRNCPITMQEHI